MKPADGKILFGPWIPDAPTLENKGLTDAKNVLFLDGSYQPFKPLGSSGMDALAAEPIGAIEAGLYTYAGTATRLYRSVTATGSWTDVSKGGSAYTSTTRWAFERFDDIVIATNGLDVPQYQTVGSGSFVDLATTGTAPDAYVVGKIGRFIFLGNTDTAEYHVQWCAIDDPNDWPTPGSADAISKQSGQQFLNPEWGAVTAISGGDQWGIIAQEGGITRVTYVGGNTAFQFDELEGSRGCFFPKSMVEANGMFYYISAAGFCVTDGVSVRQIGADKVDFFFWDSYFAPNVYRTFGAVDPNKKMIAWCYQAAAGNNATRIIFYNYQSDRFTYCEQAMNCLIGRPEQVPSSTQLLLRGFNSSHAGRLFNGSEGTAVLTTGEFSINPGARTMVQGVKPLVLWPSGVTVNETVALGTRNDLDLDSISYTSEITPHSRTRYAGFRSDAYYHRARLTLTGQFKQAVGLEVQAAYSGAA